MKNQPSLGTDPELFVVDENQNVVPASKILDIPLNSANGSIVKDGLQIELHPTANHCREVLTSNIRGCLLQLHNHLNSGKLKSKNYKISNKFVIDVNKELLKELNPEDLAIGCEPDKIAHGSAKSCYIDGTKHFKRYCGGHLHFGSANGYSSDIEEYHKNVNEIIILMDYFVGLTWVLLDHSEDNKERRKVYGKAGSYRLQPHGIEYRVLSNLWMNHPALLSLTFFLARFALYIATPQIDSLDKKDISIKNLEKILSHSKLEKIINENDYEQAEIYFKKIMNILLELGWLNPSDVNLIWLFHKKPEMNCFINNDIVKNWNLNSVLFKNQQGWNYFKDNFLVKNENIKEYNKYNIVK